jgi:mono/diheme cytochrome c family protein
MTYRPFTIAVFLLAAAGIGVAWAQTTRSTTEGVYSQEQAGRGRELYADQCTNCHGRALTGEGENGPVAGEKFRGEWEGETALTLFDRVRNTMPYKTPGTLSRQQTADLVAFLLYFNGAPAGQGELSSKAEYLSQIQISFARR